MFSYATTKGLLPTTGKKVKAKKKQNSTYFKTRTINMALFRYPGKKTWWFEFHFAGQKIRDSAKTRSKTMARRAEQKRRSELEEGYHGLRKRVPPRLFSVAAEEWLELKKPTL